MAGGCGTVRLGISLFGMAGQGVLQLSVAATVSFVSSFLCVVFK